MTNAMCRTWRVEGFFARICLIEEVRDSTARKEGRKEGIADQEDLRDVSKEELIETKVDVISDDRLGITERKWSEILKVFLFLDLFLRRIPSLCRFAGEQGTLSSSWCKGSRRRGSDT